MQCTVYSVISKINRNFISRVKKRSAKIFIFAKERCDLQSSQCELFSNSEKFVKQDSGQTYPSKFS